MKFNPNSARALKEIKKLAPLYQKHAFWDTQPVPKIYKEKGSVIKWLRSPSQDGELKQGELDEVQ